MFKSIVVAAIAAVSVIAVPISAHASTDGTGAVKIVNPAAPEPTGTPGLVSDNAAEPPLPSQPKPLQYTVAQDDTVDTIAGFHNMTVAELRWSNHDKLACSVQINPGDVLTISPVHPGIVYSAVQGDTLQDIANEFSADIKAIATINQIPDVNSIAVNQQIIVPGAQTPEPCNVAPPAPQVTTATSGVIQAASPVYSGSGPWPNHFYAGQCTWFVASKRYVPWFGNAIEWWPNARAMGFAEGYTAQIGAIVVENLSVYGHVALVIGVSAGTFTVQEENYYGPYITDTRTITIGALEVIGFIY